MDIFLKIVIFFVMTLRLWGGDEYKEFDVESAVINYEISGSDFMSNQSHLSIEGHATLLFDNWGGKTLYKEKYTQTTTGIIENKQTFSSMIFDEWGNLYDVDFDKKVINKRDDPIKKKAIETKENLYLSKIEKIPTRSQKVGTSIVLGYPCEEWMTDDIKECIYKGIVLKVEHNRDILRVKRAVKIQFDVDIHDEFFILPPYVHNESVGFLLDEKSTNIIKKSVDTPKKEQPPVEKKSENPLIPESPMSSIKIPMSIDDKALTTILFNKQKEHLPLLLEALQEARACIENADVKDEANDCLQPIIDIKEEISGKAPKSFKVEYWLEGDKEKKRNELDKEILMFKQNMPCIRRSQNIDDLSECINSKELW